MPHSIIENSFTKLLSRAAIAMCLSFAAIHSNANTAIPVEPAFEKEVCDALLGMIPEHQVVIGVWYDDPPLEERNDVSWQSNTESCHIDPNTHFYNSFQVIVDIDRHTKDPYGRTFDTIDYTVVDSNIKCLTNSDYEWECLYKKSDFQLRHRRVALQQGGHEIWVYPYTQEDFLSTTQGITSSWY